jgi:hypothetical protein
VEPDPPIVRNRGKSVNIPTLQDLIRKLSTVDRNRVLGYVEALIENQK